MKTPAMILLLIGFCVSAAPPPKQEPHPVPDSVRLFQGQRLAVDPNLPSIVFEGTRTQGLQRSVDGGARWNLLRSFPAMPLNGIGITLVVLDGSSGVKGQPTPVIFVGVAEPIGNLFWTRDGGRSWKPVLGGPTGAYPMRGRSGPDGWLYLGYVGMDGRHGGEEWALDPRTGGWRAVIR